MTQIRPATPEDLIDVARIFREAISTAEWLPEAARKFTDFGKSSGGEDVYVEFNDSDGVRGFVSVQTEDPFVHHLFVDKRFQGQGVGSALLASLEDWLPLPWTLKCVVKNKSALAFYDSLGWKVVGSGDGDHGEYSILEYHGR